MRRCAFLAVLMFLLIGGCEGNNLTENSKFPPKASGSALVVGGEAITSDQILESPVELNGTFVSPAEHLKPIAKISTLQEFKKLGRPLIEEIVTNKISQILLYQEAKRQAGKNIDEALEKAAEAEVRKFLLDFEGDQAKAEEKLKQMGMDRKSFKENRKRFVLTQWYIASKLSDNRPITYTELMNCYNQMKEQSFFTPAKIQFRLIDIQPAKLEITDPNQDQLEQARMLANKLIGQIQAGEDFGELAKQYSHGHRRDFGGLWNPVQPDSLAKPYDILAAEAEKMQPGQIAGPIEAEGHIFIMKLEDKLASGFQPFEKVQEELKQKIIFDRRREALDKLDAELMQQVAVGEKNEFIDSCLEKIYKQETGVRRQETEDKR